MRLSVWIVSTITQITNTMEISNYKHFFQLVKFASEAQSHLPFKELPFLKLINICRGYVDSSYFPLVVDNNRVEKFSSEIKDLISVHYPRGYKPNKKGVNGERYSLLTNFYKQFKAFELSRSPNPLTPINPIDSVLLVRTQRACKAFLENGMTDEQLNLLFKKMDEITIVCKQKRNCY